MFSKLLIIWVIIYLTHSQVSASDRKKSKESSENNKRQKTDGGFSGLQSGKKLLKEPSTSEQWSGVQYMEGYSAQNIDLNSYPVKQEAGENVPGLTLGAESSSSRRQKASGKEKIKEEAVENQERRTRIIKREEGGLKREVKEEHFEVTSSRHHQSGTPISGFIKREFKEENTESEASTAQENDTNYNLQCDFCDHISTNMRAKRKHLKHHFNQM